MSKREDTKVTKRSFNQWVRLLITRIWFETENTNFDL